MEDNVALPGWAHELNDFNNGDARKIRAGDGVDAADAIRVLRTRRTGAATTHAAAVHEPFTIGVREAKAPDADPVGTLLDALASEVGDEHLAECKRTLVKSGTTFAFPNPGVQIEDPHRELREVMEAYQASVHYRGVRERYCAVSLALNEEQRMAPAFRRQPKPRPVVAGKGKDDLLLHKDRLVIDLHWLWVRNIGVGTAKPQYARLLDSSAPFDFALAASFASENWSSEERATEQFALSDSVQWELATLKSRAHKDAHRMIFDGGRDGSKRVPSKSSFVRRAVARWAEESRPIRDQQAAYLHLWIAREMLGAGASAKRVGGLAALMCGRSPLDASTVRAKLKGLDRRLAASASWPIESCVGTGHLLGRVD